MPQLTTLAVFALVLSPGKALIAVGLLALITTLWSAIYDDTITIAGLLPVGAAGVGMIIAGIAIGTVKPQ